MRAMNQAKEAVREDTKPLNDDWDTTWDINFKKVKYGSMMSHQSIFPAIGNCVEMLKVENTVTSLGLSAAHNKISILIRKIEELEKELKDKEKIEDVLST